MILKGSLYNNLRLTLSQFPCQVIRLMRRYVPCQNLEKLIKMRFFVGCTKANTAQITNLSCRDMVPTRVGARHDPYRRPTPFKQALRAGTTKQFFRSICFSTGVLFDFTEELYQVLIS